MRIEQSRQSVEELNGEFETWLARRREADRRERHGSQFEALAQTVGLVLARIDSCLDRAAALHVRQVYEECRAADFRTAFVRRLWDYFRHKWDQRDDPALAPFLAAADEMVWSCQRPATTRMGRAPEAPALAYVSAEFSAHAIRPDELPAPLRRSDEVLRAAVMALPVPLIGLPYSCAAAPWWLVLVAHEVGHQVAALVEGAAEGGAIADLVGTAAGGVGDEEREWRAWSHEIFADAYAAAQLGAAQLWALVELEQGSDEAMARKRLTYPPPLVRQQLVAQYLRRIGKRAPAIPEPQPPLELDALSLSPEAQGEIERLLETVPAVVGALAEERVAGVATVGELAGLASEADHQPGASDWWREQFANQQATPEEALETPRMATVGALAEWARIAATAKREERERRSAALREQLLRVVAESGEPGYRHEEEPARADVGPLAERIAAEVLTLSVEDAAEAMTEASR